MLLDCINLYQTVLPFADDFSHSLKRGATAVNIVAEILCREEGVSRYGEAAPRPYVTGETPAGTVRDIARLARRSDSPWDLPDMSAYTGMKKEDYLKNLF